jgi:hypothetical protein
LTFLFCFFSEKKRERRREIPLPTSFERERRRRRGADILSPRKKNIEKSEEKKIHYIVINTNTLY